MQSFKDFLNEDKNKSSANQKILDFLEENLGYAIKAVKGDIQLSKKFDVMPNLPMEMYKHSAYVVAWFNVAKVFKKNNGQTVDDVLKVVKDMKKYVTKDEILSKAFDDVYEETEFEFN